VPGIYIADNGQTSSALGSLLGGIAAQVGPEGQAKAQSLRYSTESQDIANQKAAEALQAQEWATTNAGGALNQAGAQPGGVAGDVAAYATPPGPPPLVGGMRHPAGTVLSTNPYTSQVQNWIQSGQATPEAWAGSILPTGQTMAGGAGSDYGTQREVAKANMSPHDIPLGMTRVTPRPDLGAAPAGVEPKVEYGGSPVEQEVQGATAKEALADQQAGAHASDAMAQLQALQALRATVVQGHFTPGDIAYDEAAKKADQFFGTGAFTRLSGDRLDVMRAINARMKQITAATRLAFAGDPAMRGLAATLDEALPDPESDQFDNSVEALKKTLGVTVDDANAANGFLPHVASPIAAQDWRSGKLARHAAAAAAVTEALKSSGGANDVPGPNEPTPLVTNPADVPNLPPNVRFFKTIGPDGNPRIHRIPGR
jgi:hypothetical protein